MRKPTYYVIILEAITGILIVRSFFAFQEQSESVIFWIWNIGPVCMLLLSHIVYFWKNWEYSIAIVGGALVILVVAADGDLVLCALMLALLLLYIAACLMHQRGRNQ